MYDIRRATVEIMPQIAGFGSGPAAWALPQPPRAIMICMGMINFNCNNCRALLCAEEGQVGQLVQCPSCSTTLHVPGMDSKDVSMAVAPPPAVPPRAQDLAPRIGGRRYGFNCGYCSSRLEATEAMAAQEGQCPTCGNQIVIPILDRYGRLIDPKTQEIIKQDPHPVHAYAAAGERAPKIVRRTTGEQVIKCPRCGATSPVSANNCKSCGLPFTIEGTTVAAAGASNGYAVASLVLGIIGIPAGCSVLLPVLAVVFGVFAFVQISNNQGEGAGKGMAIAGIICGVIGCFVAVMVHA